MRKPTFADQFVRAVKDQLRTVRYTVRDSVRGAPRSGGAHLPRVPRPVAFAADAVFSQVEAAATVLLPRAELDSPSLTFPLPLSRYFGPQAAAEDAFTLEIYYALKGLLSRFGAGEFLVSEQAVEGARAKLSHRLGPAMEAAGEGKDQQSIAWACAAVAVEVANARPIRGLSPGAVPSSQPKHLLVAPNAYCAFVIGLSIAIESLGGDEHDGDVIIGSADMAVDARFAKLSAALRSRDAVAALAAEFATMLPFLP